MRALMFHLLLGEQAVELKVEFPVIIDAMLFMWCHCDAKRQIKELFGSAVDPCCSGE